MYRLLVLLVCSFGLYRQIEAANCHLREIDLCIATIMISATDGVPGNDEEMDRACEPIQEGFECMGNYSKACFTPFMQEVYDMIIAEPQRAQKQLCSHGTEERAKYLKHAPCMQKVLSNDNVKPHIDDMMAAFEKATESEFKQRVPIMCCGVQRLFGTALDMVRSECGEAVIEESSAVLGLPVAGLSDMFCRGYEPNSPKCNGILPPSGSPYKGVDSDNQLIRFVASAMANFA